MTVIGISVYGPQKPLTKNNDQTQTIYRKYSDCIQVLGIFGTKENVTNCGREFINLFDDGLRDVNRSRMGK